MHIAHLHIENLLGLKLLDLTPGAVNEVTGANGAGKSSVLEGLMLAFTNKGFRSHLVRDGEEEALVVVELDDGTTIRRRLREGKAGEVTVKQEGQTLGSPQAALGALFGSALAFNPIAFLELPLAEQTKLLLDLVDLDLPVEELRALGDGNLPVEYHPEAHPLKSLALVEKMLSEKRTEVGREQKRHQGAAATAKAQVPAGFEAEAVRAQNVTEINRQLVNANAYNRERREMGQQLREIGVACARRQEKIAELQEQIEDLRTANGVDCETEVSLQNYLETNPEQDTSALESQLAAYDQQREILGAFDSAATEHTAARVAETEWDRLSGLIEAVRGKPQELLAAAQPPVEGMDLVDGEVVIHGRPLADYSDSEREDLAVQIAEALAGPLKLICVDGAEKYDEGRYAALLARLEAAGFQLFVARVGEGPLCVNGVEVGAEPCCRVCGCTEARACPQGCSWTDVPNVCSACLETQEITEMEAGL
jgi:exonuclease SbcC